MGVFDRKAGRDEGGGIGSRLESLMQRSGDLVAGVTGGKDGAILRQALEARDRGNLAAAFYLVREDHGIRPEDDDSAAAFWDIAVAYERPDEAAEAVAGLIRRRAAAGAQELAVQYWVELHERVPDALVEPVAFTRILPQLSEQVDADRREAKEEAEASPPPGARKPDEEELRQREALRSARASALQAALRGVVDERNTGLSPGLALRVAELARELDPPTALRAARFAVDVEDLHEAKRQKLREMIAELEPIVGDEAAPSPTADEREAEENDPPAAAEDVEAPADDEAHDDVTDEPGTVTAEADAAPEEESEDDEDRDAQEITDAEPIPEDASELGSELQIAGIAEDDPARNHPLRIAGPPPKPLSEDELAALQARLPPSKTPHSAQCPDEACESGIDFGHDDHPFELDSSSPDLSAMAEAGAATPEPAADAAPESDAPGTSEPDAGEAEREVDVDVEEALSALPGSESESPAADRPVGADESEVDDDVAGALEALMPDAAPEPDDAADEAPEVTGSSEDEPDSGVEGSDEGAVVFDADEADPPPPPSARALEDETDADLLAAAAEFDQDLEAVRVSKELGTASPADEVHEDPEPTPPEGAALFSDLKVLPGRPVSLDDDVLVLSVAKGRSAKIELELVQAIAVAEVSGLADEPIVVIDLALDWQSAGDGPLRVVRIRSDELDAGALAPGIDDPGEALRSVLARLMEHTSAIPLPDPESALGVMIHSFATVDDYERDVLQIAR